MTVKSTESSKIKLFTIITYFLKVSMYLGRAAPKVKIKGGSRPPVSFIQYAARSSSRGR